MKYLLYSVFFLHTTFSIFQSLSESAFCKKKRVSHYEDDTKPTKGRKKKDVLIKIEEMAERSKAPAC